MGWIPPKKSYSATRTPPSWRTAITANRIDLGTLDADIREQIVRQSSEMLGIDRVSPPHRQDRQYLS